MSLPASSWGAFPFGRPNTERPARTATPSGRPADAIVVGVYPSAFHVEWTAPRYASPGRDDSRGGVKALAVDVEPTVFWDGDSADFVRRRQQWIDAVGFVEGDEPGQHGFVSLTSPSTNGSSGDTLARHHLAPLGIAPERAAFTDVYPVFLIKSSKGRSSSPRRKRQQGDAIREDYDSRAAQMGRALCTLPPRLSSKRLPAEAATRFRERIVRDLSEAAAPLVITLGEEAWATLLRVPELHARSEVAAFNDFYGDRYGVMGSLMIAGKRTEWLALVHPGLLQGDVADLEIDPAARTTAGWTALHARWSRRVRG